MISTRFNLRFLYIYSFSRLYIAQTHQNLYTLAFCNTLLSAGSQQRQRQKKRKQQTEKGEPNNQIAVSSCHSHSHSFSFYIPAFFANEPKRPKWQKRSLDRKNLLEILFIFRNNNHSIPSNDWVLFCVWAPASHQRPADTGD